MNWLKLGFEFGIVIGTALLLAVILIIAIVYGAMAYMRAYLKRGKP